MVTFNSGSTRTVAAIHRTNPRKPDLEQLPRALGSQGPVEQVQVIEPRPLTVAFREDQTEHGCTPLDAVTDGDENWTVDEAHARLDGSFVRIHANASKSRGHCSSQSVMHLSAKNSALSSPR